MQYYFVHDRELHHTTIAPAGTRPLLGNAHLLLPPLVSELHQSLHAWETIGYSPGPILAHRIRFSPEGLLIFAAENTHSRAQRPVPLLAVGQAPDLAAWLVLLDKWVDTFVVIARARTIWTTTQLAGALTFTTPAFLPPALIAQPPNNWTRVAHALAFAIADKHMTGTPDNHN